MCVCVCLGAPLRQGTYPCESVPGGQLTSPRTSLESFSDGMGRVLGSSCVLGDSARNSAFTQMRTHLHGVAPREALREPSRQFFNYLPPPPGPVIEVLQSAYADPRHGSLCPPSLGSVDDARVAGRRPT